MSKLFALTIACGLLLGVSTVSCYLNRALSLPAVNALYEDASVVHTEFVHEQDGTWALMPEGPERDQAKKEWRQRYAEAIRQVYLKHGKTPPDWCR